MIFGWLLGCSSFCVVMFFQLLTILIHTAFLLLRTVRWVIDPHLWDAVCVLLINFLEKQLNPAPAAIFDLCSHIYIRPERL
jgi:hypothetical protein